MSNLHVNRTAAAAMAETAEAEASGLFEQHGSRVYAFCLGRLHDSEDAADAVQDTYAKAWVALRDGCEVRQPLAWLLTIAGNVCTSRHRARGARPVEVPLPDDAEATVTHLSRAELAGLPTALRALPDEQRRAFVLRELRGCSYEEIGLDLGVSYSSVAALLHRSRRAIAASLGNAGRRALVAVPFPGVFKSAFEGGAAAVATTATCTILLAAPQLGSAPPQNRTLPPTPPERNVTSTAPLTAGVLSDLGSRGKTTAVNSPGVSAPAKRGAAPSRTGTAAGISASSGRAGAGDPPEASLDGSTAAPPIDSDAPSTTTEPTLTPSPRSVEAVTSPTQRKTSGAPTSVTKTTSSASASRNAEERSLPPQANGNGSPGSGAGAGSTQSHGPPADPGAQGNGPPPQANGDPGPPANPGAQGNGPPADPGGQGNGQPGNPGGQGNGPPPEGH